jgi:Rps23 Pro-64 3,4-dihydroxylase Tpa1-like proline 4-hydroxylase
MNRTALADLIVARIEPHTQALRASFQATQNKIGHFVVDDLLPVDIAEKIYRSFPDASGMRLKKSLREYKCIAAQMNNYDPILEEAIYAFQDVRVVALVSEICGIKSLHPDEHLYAGGISLMGNGHFLNPHLDNSHDKDRNKWRVLNLLYYVTPDWQLGNGGNLELWPDGMNNKQVTVHSKFNRLAVMATHDASWHSVSPVSCATASRCCVSNYYFSDTSLKPGEDFHVTTFRGRPEQKIRDLVLRTDAAARMLLRRLFRRGVVKTQHLYKK